MAARSGLHVRTQNDVAAVAWDVAEYDSYGYQRLDHGRRHQRGDAADRQRFRTCRQRQLATCRQENLDADDGAAKKYLHAISEGTDGSCGGSYLCTAGTGQYGTYSGPAGWGTPNGIGAF